MLRRLFLLLPVFCALLATPVLACECSSDAVDPEQYLRDATLVFEGEVLSRPLTSLIIDTVTIRVLSPMKGRLGDEVVIDQSRVGNCAAVFKAGERVRIVARGTAERGYHTSACLLGPLSWNDDVWPLAVAHRQQTERWAVRIHPPPTHPRCAN